MKLRSVLFALVVAIGGLTLAPQTAHAQAVATSHLVWDQDAADLATAQGYTYKHYDDGSATGTTLSGVTCAAKVPPVTGTFACLVAFPAETPGAHNMTATATNAAGESLKSTALNFTFVVIPSPPKNLQILALNEALNQQLQKAQRHG